MSSPQLVAIYHTAEHLEAKAAKNNESVRFWLENRTVVGHYNERGVYSISRERESELRTKHLVTVKNISFSAHRNGAFAIQFNGDTICIDITLNVQYYY